MIEKIYALAELLGWLDIADATKELAHGVFGEHVEYVLFLEVRTIELIKRKLNKIKSVRYLCRKNIKIELNLIIIWMKIEKRTLRTKSGILLRLMGTWHCVPNLHAILPNTKQRYWHRMIFNEKYLWSKLLSNEKYNGVETFLVIVEFKVWNVQPSMSTTFW